MNYSIGTRHQRKDYSTLYVLSFVYGPNLLHIYLDVAFVGRYLRVAGKKVLAARLKVDTFSAFLFFCPLGLHSFVFICPDASSVPQALLD